jgi:hypothetical protein
VFPKGVPGLLHDIKCSTYVMPPAARPENYNVDGPMLKNIWNGLHNLHRQFKSFTDEHLDDCLQVLELMKVPIEEPIPFNLKLEKAKYLLSNTPMDSKKANVDENWDDFLINEAFYLCRPSEKNIPFYICRLKKWTKVDGKYSLFLQWWEPKKSPKKSRKNSSSDDDGIYTALWSPREQVKWDEMGIDGGIQKKIRMTSAQGNQSRRIYKYDVKIAKYWAQRFQGGGDMEMDPDEIPV